MSKMALKSQGVTQLISVVTVTRFRMIPSSSLAAKVREGWFHRWDT